MNPPIGITADKVTTVQQWRGRGVLWQTAVRQAVKNTGQPVFVLRADGSGRLFFADGTAVRQKSWRTVRIIHPTR